MNKTLRIINLEDNANDADLNRQILLDDGLECEFVRVETYEAFVSAIRNQEFDLILADYVLPTIDGLTALCLAQEHCPDVPFIFVTDVMGEETEVESLKQGATNYVLKHNLMRLAMAARRALRDVEERRELRQAQKSFKQYKDIVNNMPVGLHVYRLEDLDDDRSLRMVVANPAAEAFTGVSQEAVLGKTLDENFPGLREKGIPRAYTDVVRNGQSIELEDVYYGDDRIIESVFAVKAFPLPDNCVGVTFENVTDRKRIEEALQESESKFRTLFEELQDGVTLTHQGIVADVNQCMIDLLGLAGRQELIGRNLLDFMTPASRAKALGEIKMIQAHQAEESKQEFTYVRSDGSEVIVDMRGSKVELGDKIYGLSVHHDITSHKRLEESLQRREQEFRTLAENLPDIVARFDRRLRHLYVNPRVESSTGIAAHTFIGKSNRELGMPEKLLSVWDKALEKVFTSGAPETMVFTLETDDGIEFFESRLIPEISQDGTVETVLGISRDITERRRREEQLSTALAEKETLLRELYHRTRNNMQVIRSMLSLRASYNKNPEFQRLVTEIGQKIQAMALVHEKLYQAQDLSRLYLDEYIDELTQLIMQSYEISSLNITLVLDIAHERVLLDTALPCGLIMTELLSNALKHAFPDGRPGTIRITLSRTDSDEFELYVSDSGVGAPQNFDFRNPVTLGLQTIIAIAEHHLQGRVSFGSGPGFTCRIRFRNNLYQARV